MTQESLIKALEEEARSQTERILAEAEQEAGRIISEAEREIEEERAERLAALEREVAGRRISLVNEARVRVASLKLRARLGVIEDVMDRALKKIDALPPDEQASIVRRFYREVRAVWPEEKADGAMVRLKPALGDIVSGDVKVVADGDISVGVVMESEDGRIRFENTVASRMEKARPFILVKLNRLIFG